jgi:hypothetical protein
MARLPEQKPDTARRWVTRVPPDPHLRVETNDYSLDPALVGRRVEVRVDQRTGDRGRAGHRRVDPVGVVSQAAGVSWSS